MKIKPIFLFLVFTTLLGINYQNHDKSQIISQSVFANGLKNEVIKSEGSASFKKVGENELQPLNSGTIVSSNDQIIKPHNSQITILCTNGSLWYVPDGTSVVKNGCLNTNRSNTNDTNLKQPTNTYAF